MGFNVFFDRQKPAGSKRPDYKGNGRINRKTLEYIMEKMGEGDEEFELDIVGWKKQGKNGQYQSFEINIPWRVEKERREGGGDDRDDRGRDRDRRDDRDRGRDDRGGGGWDRGRDVDRDDRRDTRGRDDRDDRRRDDRDGDRRRDDRDDRGRDDRRRTYEDDAPSSRGRGDDDRGRDREEGRSTSSRGRGDDDRGRDRDEPRGSARSMSDRRPPVDRLPEDDIPF